MFLLRMLDFLPQVLVLFVLLGCVVDQFFKVDRHAGSVTSDV